MTGVPTWEQIIWLVTLVCATAAAGFYVAWRVSELRAKDRHDVKKAFEQQVRALEDSIEVQALEFEHRLRLVEDFKTGTMIVLQNIQEFKKDMDLKFETLREKREKDIQGIHDRLDVIFNDEQMRG